MVIIIMTNGTVAEKKFCYDEEYYAPYCFDYYLTNAGTVLYRKLGPTNEGIKCSNDATCQVNDHYGDFKVARDQDMMSRQYDYSMG